MGDDLVTEQDQTGDRGAEDARFADRELLESSRFNGEMVQTVFGNLHGAYTWECDHVPSEEEIREGLCLRVVHDCSKLRTNDRLTKLTDWHGGWTREGLGIFSTEVWSTSRGKRTRRRGSAAVLVRTPDATGSHTWNGIAC